MKNQIKILIMMLVAVMSSVIVYAQESNQDSVLSAKYFAENPVVEYQCNAWYLMVNGEDYSHKELSFIYKPNFGIVEMWTDEVEILTRGERPIHVLPFPDSGSVYNLHVFARGMNKDGVGVVTGSGSLSWPKNHDTITIGIYPDSAERYIPFKLDNNLNPHDTYLRIENRTFSYNNNWKGFHVWYNPSILEQKYQIISGGIVLLSGIFNPLTGLDHDSVPEGSSMSFETPGLKIIDLSFVENQALKLSELTGSTQLISGQVQPAEVYLIKGGQNPGVWVWIDNVMELEVTFFAPVNGELIELISNNSYMIEFERGQNLHFSFFGEDYYENIIMVVTRAQSFTPDPIQLIFSVDFGKG